MLVFELRCLTGTVCLMDWAYGMVHAYDAVNVRESFNREISGLAGSVGWDCRRQDMRNKSCVHKAPKWCYLQKQLFSLDDPLHPEWAHVWVPSLVDSQTHTLVGDDRMIFSPPETYVICSSIRGSSSCIFPRVGSLSVDYPWELLISFRLMQLFILLSFFYISEGLVISVAGILSVSVTQARKLRGDWGGPADMRIRVGVVKTKSYCLRGIVGLIGICRCSFTRFSAVSPAPRVNSALLSARRSEDLFGTLTFRFGEMGKTHLFYRTFVGKVELLSCVLHRIKDGRNKAHQSWKASGPQVTWELRNGGRFCPLRG